MPDSRPLLDMLGGILEKVARGMATFGFETWSPGGGSLWPGMDSAVAGDLDSNAAGFVWPGTGLYVCANSWLGGSEPRSESKFRWGKFPLILWELNWPAM